MIIKNRINEFSIPAAHICSSVISGEHVAVRKFDTAISDQGIAICTSIYYLYIIIVIRTVIIL